MGPCQGSVASIIVVFFESQPMPVKFVAWAEPVPKFVHVRIWGSVLLSKTNALSGVVFGFPDAWFDPKYIAITKLNNF